MSDINSMVENLRALNARYEMTVVEREALPMNERRFKWERLQNEANLTCGEIMRTERAIINALLAEERGAL